MLYFKQLPIGPMQNWVYVVGDSDTKQAAVIDPAWNVPAIVQEVEADGYTITHIILTHGHYDHINGVEDLLAKTDATVCAQSVELEKFIPQGAGGLSIPRSSLKKSFSGESVVIGKIEITQIHTPGHTPGSQCLLVRSPDSGSDRLITGDTLFIGTCGRCDFPYSKPEELFRSLQRLKALKGDTVFYPGHDYGQQPSNTIDQERTTNPFLMMENLSQFLQLVGR
ncbi:MAG TPA: MBL fold metallo-hydrolase [Elusimicrobiota bacterium]|nr:MBL fold metallo-hydrolase [Elusimicrobiota bacterium]